MAGNRAVSRRAFVVGAAVTPVAAVTSTIRAETNSPDAELIALGDELDSIPAALDCAGEHGQAIALLNRIDTLTAKIVAMPATSLDGLYVKARATSWGLISDYDPCAEISNDMRIVVSLLRDLMRLGKSS
jgi:hypothetical protein